MGFVALEGRASSLRPQALAAVALLAAVLALAWAAAPAPAASIVAKDGKIHACYKAKGKAKGTLRVVRGAKVRCPRGWKKAAWNAGGPAGSDGAAGENGSGGGSGEAGAPGSTGANGTTTEKANVASLEKQVTDLLAKVKSLEGILSGISNVQLKDAIGAVPVVQTLCAQSKTLTEQSNGMGSALGGLGAVVDTLTILALPAVPSALPAFQCP